MSGERSHGISDAAMLMAIGTVVGFAALVWLWGGIAGAVFGGGWPRVGAGQLLGVLVRLPARLSDPAGAWPAQVRGELPGPLDFYASLVLIAVPLLVLARSGAVASLTRRD